MKISNYLFLAIAGLLLASCGSSNSPESTIRNTMNALIQGDCEGIKANCSEDQAGKIDEWCSDESDFGRDVERAKDEFGDSFDWKVVSITAEVEFESLDGKKKDDFEVVLENGVWKMAMN